MKLLKASIALAAFAAVFVVPSIASAGPTLTAPTGTAYKGTYIEAENVGVTKMTLPAGIGGSVECQTATMTGDLTTNSGGHVSGDIETVEFRGRPKQANPHESNQCDSPLGAVSVTPNHTTNPKQGGVGSLNWCLTANTNDNKFTVRGGNCTEATRPLTFTLHTPIGECAYSKASVTGSYTTHPNDAVLTLSEQEFTKSVGSAFCPGSGKLDMSFTLRTDDANTQPMYIDTV
jgi:hypothetical protein